MAIGSCKDKRTAAFLAGQRIKEFQSFERQAVKALTKLGVVQRLIELRSPPSNRFEALSGDRAGQFSIRINDRWRVCFRWASEERGPIDPLLAKGHPYDVEITDYH